MAINDMLRENSLARFSVIWNGLYLDYDSKRERFHRPKFRELFESEKIMIRRVSGQTNRLLAQLDNSGLYTNDNIIHVVPWNETIRTLQSPGDYQIDDFTTDYSLSALLALINSTLVSWYFSVFIATGTLQGSYSGIYPEDVRQLPIRKVEFITSTEKRAQLREKSKELYKEHESVHVLGLVDITCP